MSRYREYQWEEGPVDAHGYLYNSLLSILDKRKNRRILDVGCGNGELANRLIREGFDVYGIDASEQGIAIAGAMAPDRFHVVDLDEGRMPGKLRDKGFDTVLSTDVIEHLYDPRRFVDFCRDILSESGGGELIISTPYHGYFKNCAISLLNGWDRHFTALWDGGHIKFWSKNTLGLLLNEFEFDEIEFKGYGRLPLFWKGMLIKARLTKGASQ